jgi:hypothetical protein
MKDSSDWAGGLSGMDFVVVIPVNRLAESFERYLVM